MTPGNFNFPIHKRGDTFNGYAFTVTVNNVAEDFTGAVVKIQLRKKNETAVILEWGTADGSVTITGASHNTINMGIKTGAQMNIEPFKYIYDVQVLLANGVTNTYVEGIFEIANDVSR